MSNAAHPIQPRERSAESDDALGALAPLAGEVATTMARLASDLALVIDADGVIRSVAEADLRDAPLSVRDWVGRRWVDTVSAESRGKLETLLAEAQQGGRTRRREVNHPLAEGDPVPVAWTAIRLGDTGPVVAVGRDLRAVAAIQRRFLDAQHDMERDYWQRRQAENRYRLMFQVASDAVLVLDAATLRVVEANSVAHAWLADAQPADEAANTSPIVGQPLPGLFVAGARAAVRELLVTARSSGRAGEIRIRIGDPSAAGEGDASDISATPFTIGAQLHLLVRARRLATAPAAHAPESVGTPLPSMAAFVESTPDGVVVCDAAGRIVSANPAFAALVQCASEALLLGRELAEVVDDGGSANSPIAEGWRALIGRARQHGLVPRGLLQLRHGLITLTVEASAALLAEGDQEHIGFIVRSSELAEAGPRPGFTEAALTLAELASQVGHLPLAELMREAAHVAERQFVETALVRSGGLLAAAAAMLGLRPEALALRMKRLNLTPTVGTEKPPTALN